MSQFMICNLRLTDDAVVLNFVKATRVGRFIPPEQALVSDGSIVLEFRSDTETACLAAIQLWENRR